MTPLDALDAVTLLLRADAGVQTHLGVSSEAAAAKKIRGAAPEPGDPLPVIWTDDQGGQPLDRAMGGDWTLRQTNVGIWVAASKPELAGALIEAVEDALDNVADQTLSDDGYEDVTVSWLAVTGLGDERWELGPGAYTRGTVAEVITERN